MQRRGASARTEEHNMAIIISIIYNLESKQIMGQEITKQISQDVHSFGDLDTIQILSTS